MKQVRLRGALMGALLLAVGVGLAQEGPSGPAATLVSPSAGQVVSGVVQLSASVSAAAAAQFELDGAPLNAAMTAPPYAAAWDSRRASDGEHALSVVALDAAGAKAISAPVRVTIKNRVPRPGTDRTPR